MFGLGGDFEFPFGLNSNVVFPHQPGYSGPAAFISLFFQFIRDSGAAVSLTTLFMNSFYLVKQYLILLLPFTWYSMPPAVITCSGDS